jgi:integrase
LLTGRRRAEVFNLKRKDLTFDDGRWHYTYRGKGGKQSRRECPSPP